MGSSRRRANTITCISSRLFFLLIIFQVPLFRVQCRSGICTNPVQVTSFQLIASEILPIPFVKILLYPGAVANTLVKGITIPNYDDLLDFYNLSNVKEASSVFDLRHLEILAGSYLCVAGAILGLLNYARLSLFGMLLLSWGLIKEVLRQNATCVDQLDACQTVQVSPIMFVALFSALSSIKSDVRLIIRSFRAHQAATEAEELHESVKKKKKAREMKRLEWTVNDVRNSKTPRSTKVAQTGINNTFS